MTWKAMALNVFIPLSGILTYIMKDYCSQISYSVNDGIVFYKNPSFFSDTGRYFQHVLDQYPWCKVSLTSSDLTLKSCVLDGGVGQRWTLRPKATSGFDSVFPADPGLQLCSMTCRGVRLSASYSHVGCRCPVVVMQRSAGWWQQSLALRLVGGVALALTVRALWGHWQVAGGEAGAAGVHWCSDVCYVPGYRHIITVCIGLFF